MRRKDSQEEGKKQPHPWFTVPLFHFFILTSNQSNQTGGCHSAAYRNRIITSPSGLTSTTSGRNGRSAGPCRSEPSVAKRLPWQGQ